MTTASRLDLSAAVDLKHVAAHHLVTALAITGPWLVLTRVVTGVPPVVLLLVVVGGLLPPVTVWQVRRRLDCEGVRGRLARRRRLGLVAPTARDAVRSGLPALGASLVLPGLVVWAEPSLRRLLHVPDAWSTGWPATDSLTPAATAALLALWLVVAVVAGPVCEEVLFRGLLQPLVAEGPWTRILVGSALFSVYHVWQPWSWPAVFLAVLPVAWVRERTGSVVLAAAVHVTGNAVAWGLLVAGAMQR